MEGDELLPDEIRRLREAGMAVTLDDVRRRTACAMARVFGSGLKWDGNTGYFQFDGAVHEIKVAELPRLLAMILEHDLGELAAADPVALDDIVGMRIREVVRALRDLFSESSPWRTGP
ncbi:hypothetical protein HYV30_00840 [Candidatus Kaiserbacteria bacterium]|nr:hypothetical protein [Candidatus Kaiserbacteria bacterium]